MGKTKSNEPRYTELSQDIVDKFKEIYDTKSFPMPIGFEYVNDTKLKTAIKIQKLNEFYQFALGKEIVVYVNEDLYDKLDDDQIQILFEQEIDKISVNFENGKITMVKPDLVTSAPIIKKYGADAVLRANQIDVLSSEQEAELTTGYN